MKLPIITAAIFSSLGAIAAPVCINEFLADNTSTSLTDEDNDSPDWIELHNTTGATASLGGLYLTDDTGDLTKWPLPAVTIPGGGYLVVFASGKDRAPTNGSPLHTNFRLSDDGDYLALVDADGTTVLSEFGPSGVNYPKQRPGVSYGLRGSPPEASYFLNPTPDTANDEGSAVAGFVEDTRFDVDRGFFDDPFDLIISTGTPGATIRFTTDGSWPDANTGTIYQEPIRIDRTLTLKAIAYKEGHVPSNIDTQTYIFVSSVVRQSAGNTMRTYGFPATWNGQAPYYGMDNNPAIDPAGHRTIQGDLQKVPSLSISMETDDLFGSNGIYSNPQNSGVSWERKASLEFIDPATPEGGNTFQQNCAIRIQGGAFRSFGLTRKKSFRVLFKPEWGPQAKPTGGPGKLDFPLFGPDAASEFQTLVFRMESNDGWQWNGAGNQPQYARDEFGRRLQLALGQPASHGRFCHLYLNGVYWGLYNVVERPDSGFAETYFGADRELWQGQNSGSPINSAHDLSDWSTMLAAVDDISLATTDALRDREYLQACGFTETGRRSSRAPTWIDPVNFADYLLVNWYGGNSDWPHKNYYCGRARERSSTGFKFFMWDAEWSLFLRSSLTTNRTGTFTGVAAPQQHLERSPEYRVLFGDRAHRALFNGGALTPEATTALYNEITAQHRNILNPEAARWGNQHGGAHSADHWQIDYNRLVKPDPSGWFFQRADILLGQLRQRKLYPDIEAPVYSQHGGTVPFGNGPTLRVPDTVTKIYYTYGAEDEDPTDYGHSLDPRLVGGAINPAATLIDFGTPGRGGSTFTSAPLSLTEPGFLYSRSYNESTGDWSALNVALFTLDTVPATADNIVISEVHYHPAASGQDEIDAGFADEDLFEFLEVQNIGAVNVDMTNVGFTNGIDFDFAPGFTIPAGERVVIVKNLAAFTHRYPAVPAGKVAGVFLNDTGLSNSGESLALRGADGDTIKSFTYDDEAPWPTEPDGSGVSLVLVDPLSRPDHTLHTSWRAGSVPQGTPGADELTGPFAEWMAAHGATGPDAPFGSSSLSNLFAFTVGADLTPTPEAALPAQVSVEVGGTTYPALRFRVRQDLGEVGYFVEVSGNLALWQSGGAFTTQVGPPVDNGDGTLTLTVRSLQSLAAKPHQFLRLRASLPGTGASPFAEWMADRSATDPDGPFGSSSLSNLFAFTVGADLTPTPEAALPAQVSVEVGGTTYPALRFRVRQDLGEVGYFVEVSGNLVLWQSGGAFTTQVGTPMDNGDGTLTLTVRSLRSLAAKPHQFLRLRTAPPGTGTGPFAEWMADHGATDPAASFGSSSLSNLLAFTVGADLTPTPEAALPTIAIVDDGGLHYPALRFRIRQDLGEVGYFVEVSENLAPWQSGDACTAQVGLPVDNGDGTRTLTVRSLQSLATKPHQYLRLRVVLAP